MTQNYSNLLNFGAPGSTSVAPGAYNTGSPGSPPVGGFDTGSLLRSVLGGNESNLAAGGVGNSLGGFGDIGNFGGGGNGFNAGGVLGATQPGMSFGDKLGLGINAGSALLNGYLGMKQFGLAKDQLAFSKEAFNKNYGNQVKQTNQSTAARYANAQAANPEAFSQSLSDYMKENSL